MFNFLKTFLFKKISLIEIVLIQLCHLLPWFKHILFPPTMCSFSKKFGNKQCGEANTAHYFEATDYSVNIQVLFLVKLSLKWPLVIAEKNMEKWRKGNMHFFVSDIELPKEK